MVSLSAVSVFVWDPCLQTCTFSISWIFISPTFHLFFLRAGPGQYETRLLETSIQKITALLRVGFGEAGAGIISANLKTRDSSATIDPLLPGGELVYTGYCMLFSLFYFLCCRLLHINCRSAVDNEMKLIILLCDCFAMYLFFLFPTSNFQYFRCTRLRNLRILWYS